MAILHAGCDVIGLDCGRAGLLWLKDTLPEPDEALPEQQRDGFWYLARPSRRCLGPQRCNLQKNVVG